MYNLVVPVRTFEAPCYGRNECMVISSNIAMIASSLEKHLMANLCMGCCLM